RRRPSVRSAPGPPLHATAGHLSARQSSAARRWCRRRGAPGARARSAPAACPCHHGWQTPAPPDAGGHQPLRGTVRSGKGAEGRCAAGSVRIRHRSPHLPVILMIRALSAAAALPLVLFSAAASPRIAAQAPEAPRLLVVVVVDQMRN